MLWSLLRWPFRRPRRPAPPADGRLTIAAPATIYVRRSGAYGAGYRDETGGDR